MRSSTLAAMSAVAPRIGQRLPLTTATTAARVRRLGSSPVVVVRVRSVVSHLDLPAATHANTELNVASFMAPMDARKTTPSTRLIRLRPLDVPARTTSEAKTFEVGGRLPVVVLAARTPATACSLPSGRRLQLLLVTVLE